VLPEVPTFAEHGYPTVAHNTGLAGMWAPAGTPRERIVRLNTEIVRIHKTPDMRARIENPVCGLSAARRRNSLAFIIERDTHFLRKRYAQQRLSPVRRWVTGPSLHYRHRNPENPLQPFKERFFLPIRYPE
jgi:hypothetical protein